MAVLINGMQIPKSCMECPLFNGHGCTATNTMFSNMTNVAVRTKGCPLVEVPKGAILIDANEIEEKISLGLQEPDYQHECESWVMGLLMARDYVENASIIFEEGE